MSVQRACSDRVATVHHPFSGRYTRYTLIASNALGFCQKWSVYRPCSDRDPSPHTPLWGFAPLGGLGAPFRAYPMRWVSAKNGACTDRVAPCWPFCLREGD